jgi:hypothetical protein
MDTDSKDNGSRSSTQSHVQDSVLRVALLLADAD